MKKLLLSFSFLIPIVINAQIRQQYFDGADTAKFNSVIVRLDTSSSNVWQIGKPQKQIFDSAATQPNAIVTDTINYYPVNNISRWSFTIGLPLVNWGIMAVRWKQKLDLDSGRDGGIVEISTNGGNTWVNVFNNPIVYNFYGYDTTNKDTLATGEVAFSGTDSTWRDIWLCFDESYLSTYDSLIVRFTLQTDSINNNKEGWVIDNLIEQKTWAHTVKKMEEGQYMRVFPTQTNGIVNIEAQKLQEFHIIKSMQLVDMQGRVVQEYGTCPTKYYIDISGHPDGMYHLKVNTNKRSETFPVILSRN